MIKTIKKKAEEPILETDPTKLRIDFEYLKVQSSVLTFLILIFQLYFLALSAKKYLNKIKDRILFRFN